MGHDRPPVPVRREPAKWEHYPLWQRVRDAIRAVPDHFSSPTVIEGLLAGDIFTLNAPLAATIEEQVVRTLNALRPVWDPDRTYQTYAFVWQPQTFPDVLRKAGNRQDVLMGIELKGWYLLAREGAPTYRFTVAADACNPQDLLVVVPLKRMRLRKSAAYRCRSGFRSSSAMQPTSEPPPAGRPDRDAVSQ